MGNYVITTSRIQRSIQHMTSDQDIGSPVEERAFLLGIREYQQYLAHEGFLVMAYRSHCRQVLKRLTRYPYTSMPPRLHVGASALASNSPAVGNLMSEILRSTSSLPRASFHSPIEIDLAGQRRLKHATKKGKGGKSTKGAKEEKKSAAEDDEVESLDDIASISDTKARYNRVLEGLKNEFHGLRGGKPDPAMLDHVQVDSYGSPVALSTVAQASMKGPQLIVLTVYDPGLTKAVEEGIRECGMSLNPFSEGQGQVDVPIPKTTKESRDAMAKVAAKHAEKAKVVLRGIRHKVLDQVKKRKDAFPEDDVHQRLKEIDKCTQEAESSAGKLLEKKKAEIVSL